MVIVTKRLILRPFLEGDAADVYEYLKYLLTETPNNHHLEDPSVIDSLLPWSKELPEQCLLKRNRKKCLKH